MRDAWNRLCPFPSQRLRDKTYENCDSVTLVIDGIVEKGRKLNLEINAEGVIELINSPDPELTIDELIELKKQNTVEEIDEDFEPNIMTVSKLTDGLNIIEAGMTVLQNIDSDEKSVETSRRKVRKLILLLKRASKIGVHNIF